MKAVLLLSALILSAEVSAATLIGSCQTKGQKQTTDILVDAKGLSQLFTGAKSVNGTLHMTDEDIKLPSTFKRPKGSTVENPIVAVSSNYMGNIVNFTLNLEQNTQDVYVHQTYNGQNYDFEMFCELK